MELNSFHHKKIKEFRDHCVCVCVRAHMCMLVLISFSGLQLPSPSLAGDLKPLMKARMWRLLVGILCWRVASCRGDRVMHEGLFNALAKWFRDHDFIMLPGRELWFRIPDLEPLRAPATPPRSSRGKYSFMVSVWSEKDTASRCSAWETVQSLETAREACPSAGMPGFLERTRRSLAFHLSNLRGFCL